MPNKRVAQAPERKLPAICSAPHNYQQEVVERPIQRAALSSSRMICIALVNNVVTQQRGDPLVCVFMPASSCGNVKSWLCVAPPLPASLKRPFPLPQRHPIEPSAMMEMFCTDTLAVQDGSHKPHAATGHLTCGFWDRGTRFFNSSVINLNVNSAW